jgi:hypothetical protein
LIFRWPKNGGSRYRNFHWNFHGSFYGNFHRDFLFCDDGRWRR